MRYPKPEEEQQLKDLIEKLYKVKLDSLKTAESPTQFRLSAVGEALR